MYVDLESIKVKLREDDLANSISDAINNELGETLDNGLWKRCQIGTALAALKRRQIQISVQKHFSLYWHLP